MVIKITGVLNKQCKIMFKTVNILNIECNNLSKDNKAVQNFKF